MQLSEEERARVRELDGILAIENSARTRLRRSSPLSRPRPRVIIGILVAAIGLASVLTAITLVVHTMIFGGPFGLLHTQHDISRKSATRGSHRHSLSGAL